MKGRVLEKNSRLNTIHKPSVIDLEYKESVGVGIKVFSMLLGVLALVFVRDIRQLLVNLILLMVLAQQVLVLRQMAERVKPFVWISLIIILIHSLFNPINHHYIYFFGLEGFKYGSTVAIRLLCIVVVANMLVLTTDITFLVRWFGQISPDLGIIFGLVLSVVPVMRKQLTITLEVQRARGLRQDRLLERFFAFVAVIVPVIIKSIIRAHTMAKLLYLRGYDQKRVKETHKLSRKDLLLGGLVMLYLLLNLSVSLTL